MLIQGQLSFCPAFLLVMTGTAFIGKHYVTAYRLDIKYKLIVAIFVQVVYTSIKVEQTTVSIQEIAMDWADIIITFAFLRGT